MTQIKVTIEVDGVARSTELQGNLDSSPDELRRAAERLLGLLLTQLERKWVS